MPQMRPPAREDVLLFRSAGGSPLRVVNAVALVFALGSALLAGLLLDGDLRMGHMDHMITADERAIWAGSLLTAFCGFFTAVWMYGRRVADKLSVTHDGRTLKVATPTLFGSAERHIAVDDLMAAQYHDGDRAGQEATSPPWVWVKVRGTRSFVVPLSGHIPSRDRLLDVLSVDR